MAKIDKLVQLTRIQIGLQLLQLALLVETSKKQEPEAANAAGDALLKLAVEFEKVNA